MSAADYRDALQRLGLTQAAAARLIGVDARTSQKWALGERRVPSAVIKLLAYIERYGQDVAAST